MTANQIDYGKHLEVQIHNRATEAQAQKDYEENVRHNTASEAEATRHNVANEDEAKRHNLADESNATLKITTEANTATKDRASKEGIAQADRENSLKIAQTQGKYSVKGAKVTAKGRTDAAKITGTYNILGKQMEIDYNKWKETESPAAKKTIKEMEKIDADIDYLGKKAYREQLDSASQRSLNRALKRAAEASQANTEADTALKNKDLETYYQKIEERDARITKTKAEIQDIANRYGLDLWKTYNDAALKAADMNPVWWHKLTDYYYSLEHVSESGQYIMDSVKNFGYPSGKRKKLHGHSGSGSNF